MKMLLDNLKRGALLLALVLVVTTVSACASGPRQAEPDQRDQQGAGMPEQADNNQEQPTQSEVPAVTEPETTTPEIAEPETTAPEAVEPETAAPVGNMSAAELYRSVLLGGLSFRVADTAQILTIDNIKLSFTDEESIQVQIPQFSVVDLDRDGVPEVVLWLRVNDVNDIGFEVLHCIGGEVYSYVLYTRQFNDLKTDGTFNQPGGASDSSSGTLTFSETGYIIHDAGSLGDTDVTWYEFTPDNIDTILGDA